MTSKLLQRKLELFFIEKYILLKWTDFKQIILLWLWNKHAKCV